MNKKKRGKEELNYKRKRKRSLVEKES